MPQTLARTESAAITPQFGTPLPVYVQRRQQFTHGPIVAVAPLVNGYNRVDTKKETAPMTCKIERHADGHQTTLRLIGHIQAEHLEALQAQLEGNGPRIVLDLDEVTLVDVEVVRFLAGCEAAGMAIIHCPSYIREWIRREQASPG